MSQYRLKFILEDGRKVYASKRGKIQLNPKEHLERFLPSTKNNAYSTDLSLFSSPDILKRMNLSYVKIEGAEIEEASEPIDPEAFIAGGQKASDAG